MSKWKFHSSLTHNHEVCKQPLLKAVNLMWFPCQHGAVKDKILTAMEMNHCQVIKKQHFGGKIIVPGFKEPIFMASHPTRVI